MAVYAVVVCLSVTSPCSTKTAKRRIMQTMPYDSPVFWCRRSQQNSKGITPSGGAKCRWGQVKIGNFRQITCYDSKTSTVASIVNLFRSQIYYTERPPLFAARLPWRSALRGFVSNSWYWLSLCANQHCWLDVVVYWHVNIVCCRRHLICVATVGVATSAWVDIEQWRDSFVSTCAVYWRLGADWIVWGTAKRDCYSWWVTVIPSSMHSRSRRPVHSVSSLASGPRW